MNQILRPYNSVYSRQLSSYVVFDDYIYVLEEGFHPGGQVIIDRVKGREVDRYLYGMYPLEDYINSERHTHSTNILQTIGRPIGILPKNPMYSIGRSK
jgi:hypothetical protein